MTQAISLVGLSLLARAVGVSTQAIRKFERGACSAERVIPVAQATGWRVTPHQLRPDLYPNQSDALPPELLASVMAALAVEAERRASERRREERRVAERRALELQIDRVEPHPHSTNFASQ